MRAEGGIIPLPVADPRTVGSRRCPVAAEKSTAPSATNFVHGVPDVVKTDDLEISMPNTTSTHPTDAYSAQYNYLAKLEEASIKHDEVNAPSPAGLKALARARIHKAA